MIRELDERQLGVTRSQTVNSLAIVVLAAVMMLLGVALRNSAQAATIRFRDDVSGIGGQIPAGWLLNTDDPSFVMQAQDPGATPFKTLLQVSVLPVGADATPRNVVDMLTLQRSGALSTYRPLSIETTLLGDSEALEITYSYVEAETNPFLSSIPLVVVGRDVVVIRGNQALILTYREERSRFDENEAIFETFLNTLEF